MVKKFDGYAPRLAIQTSSPTSKLVGAGEIIGCIVV
jgi:hypothetical protein